MLFGGFGFRLWCFGVWCCVLVCVVCCGVCGVAFGLSGGRVFEMVSPLFKGGYDVPVINAVGSDGGSVVFESLGVFGGTSWDSLENVYLARRGVGGWVTSSLDPPPVGRVADFSVGLGEVLGVAPVGASKLGPPQDEEVFLLHDTGLPDGVGWGVFGGVVLKELVSEPAVNFQAPEVGASGDLCHVIVGDTAPLLVEAVGTQGQVYDLAGGCGGVEPSLRLVGVRNNPGVPGVIDPVCPVELGVGLNYADGEQEADFNAVSVDGSKIFFTSTIEGSGCREGASFPHQLFVRLGGSVTLEVSRPLDVSKAFGGCEKGGVVGEVPCEGAAGRASAYFKGASEDGSLVFFTTSTPLVSGDTDSSNDLYMARIGCPEGEAGCEVAQERVLSLVQVSHASSGEPGEVVSVVRVASDGERVYFVGRGVLSEAPNAEGQVPVRGAENLYVYDSVSGKTVFVTDRGSVGSSHSTADGRFLVFTSAGQLLRSDTDTAQDVYRYDAVTGVLDRVSTGEAGYHANGNDSAFDAQISGGGINPGPIVSQDHEMSTRAISEDGSRIVFETAEPLSPFATNGLNNIYEWYEPEGSLEGQVSLVSSGFSLTADRGVVMSPSGGDIFFLTSQGLVPQDTDGLEDVYDARLGGGFPALSAPRQPCSGDACQGPLTNPAPLLVPGSVSQAPGGNFAAPKKATPVKKKAKAKKAKAKGKAKGRRLGRVKGALRARRGGMAGRGRGRR